MSKSIFKYNIGDVVYIPCFCGGIPYIDESIIKDRYVTKSMVKISNSISEPVDELIYNTSTEDYVPEHKIFKTKQQAYKALKRDVKSVITTMKLEMKRIEEELKIV